MTPRCVDGTTTKDDWAERCAEWEASPRRGLTWLLASPGGRWEITEKAVRRKRLAEVWVKPQDRADIARRARARVDPISAARIAAQGYGPGPPDENVGEWPDILCPRENPKSGWRVGLDIRGLFKCGVCGFSRGRSIGGGLAEKISTLLWRRRRRLPDPDSL